MVKRNSVKTLAQLRQRKSELQLEMEVTKREMAHGLGVMRTDLNSYLLTRVALPVGGSVLGFYLIKKFFLDKNDSVAAQTGTADAPPRAYAAPPQKSSVNISQLIKIGVPIIQAAMGFLAGYTKKAEEED